MERYPVGTASEHSCSGTGNIPLDGSTGTAAERSYFQDRHPIIEVAFRNGMWWSIPQEMSRQLYEHFLAGEDACYTWDWGDTRNGSWQPDSEQNTSINRYIINFDRMEQKNIDNNRTRSVRIGWVRNEDVTARWTGQIPEQ